MLSDAVRQSRWMEGYLQKHAVQDVECKHLSVVDGHDFWCITCWLLCRQIANLDKGRDARQIILRQADDIAFAQALHQQVAGWLQASHIPCLITRNAVGASATAIVKVLHEVCDYIIANTLISMSSLTDIC